MFTPSLKLIVVSSVIFFSSVLGHGNASSQPDPNQPPMGPPGGSTSTPGTSSSSSTTTTHKAHHAKKASHTYKGTVASVDATAKSFVVHPAKGADVTLKVNDKTKYSPAGKGWDDVKVDAMVSGSLKNDGTDNWAVTVKFKAEKAAPAKSGSK
jgi:hypothetical protein